MKIEELRFFRASLEMRAWQAEKDQSWPKNRSHHGIVKQLCNKGESPDCGACKKIKTIKKRESDLVGELTQASYEIVEALGPESGIRVHQLMTQANRMTPTRAKMKIADLERYENWAQTKVKVPKRRGHDSAMDVFLGQVLGLGFKFDKEQLINLQLNFLQERLKVEITKQDYDEAVQRAERIVR